ncbi:MAG: hypothetical protein IPO06_06945 [Leptospiraceae bacterium]|nr:hypothetical protein [Leptospiraceae bacterium]
MQTNEKAAEQAATEVFDLLQGQVTVSATKIAKKTNEAPNIVSVISDKQIKDYGRFLLMIFSSSYRALPSQVNIVELFHQGVCMKVGITIICLCLLMEFNITIYFMGQLLPGKLLL